MVTLVGTQENFLDALKDLLEFEYEAIEIYEAAINRVDNNDYGSTLSFAYTVHHSDSLIKLVEYGAKLALGKAQSIFKKLFSSFSKKSGFLRHNTISRIRLPTRRASVEGRKRTIDTCAPESALLDNVEINSGIGIRRQEKISVRAIHRGVLERYNRQGVLKAATHRKRMD